MLRVIAVAAALGVVATACTTPAPLIVTENPPHYVIVQQALGLADADSTVRVGADNAADAKCREWGRVARLPAHDAVCSGRHPFFPTICMGYQYTYECILDDAL